MSAYIVLRVHKKIYFFYCTFYPSVYGYFYVFYVQFLPFKPTAMTLGWGGGRWSKMQSTCEIHEFIFLLRVIKNINVHVQYIIFFYFYLVSATTFSRNKNEKRISLLRQLNEVAAKKKHHQKRSLNFLNDCYKIQNDYYSNSCSQGGGYTFYFNLNVLHLSYFNL